MKNFKITAKEDGKEYWISRAMAVTGIVRAIKIPESENEEPEIFYLISKRGAGSPDYVGKWQCTCGYLDFDENLSYAVLREIYEETGLDLRDEIDEEVEFFPIQPINEKKVFNFQFLELDDSPSHDPRQNVVARYLVDVNYNWIKELLDNGTINCQTETRGGEPGEIDDIRLVKGQDLDKDPYIGNFAFNHERRLNELRYPRKW